MSMLHLPPQARAPSGCTAPPVRTSTRCHRAARSSRYDFLFSTALLPCWQQLRAAGVQPDAGPLLTHTQSTRVALKYSPTNTHCSTRPGVSPLDGYELLLFSISITLLTFHQHHTRRSTRAWCAPWMVTSCCCSAWRGQTARPTRCARCATPTHLSRCVGVEGFTLSTPSDAVCCLCLLYASLSYTMQLTLAFEVRCLNTSRLWDTICALSQTESAGCKHNAQITHTQAHRHTGTHNTHNTHACRVLSRSAARASP